MLVEASSTIGTSSIKDSKPTNEALNQLPSSQPLSIITTTTTIATDLAETSASINTSMPIIRDKGNISESYNNQVSLSSTSGTISPCTTNNVLGNVVNVGKFCKIQYTDLRD